MSDSEEYQNQEHITSSTEHVPIEVPTPSAPTSDDNGYIVVQNTQNTEAELLASTRQQEEISNLLADISSNTETNLKEPSNTVFAEADSSVTREIPPVEKKTDENKKPSAQTCSLCPYYLLACDYLSNLEIPPQVRDLLLWKCPKMTGAVFGSLFVVLLSLSLFSFLTVISTLMLTALAVVGSYRFYLAVVFRIKGTYDDSLDKLAKHDLPLPKDKVQEVARLIETDLFRGLNTLKSIVLWENVTQSVKALVAFYLVNWVGSCFNFLTLLMLALVTVFTLPKVYQVYKQPIDQAIQKVTTLAHQVTKQVMAKIPMLNKKKTQ